MAVSDIYDTHMHNTEGKVQNTDLWPILINVTLAVIIYYVVD